MKTKKNNILIMGHIRLLGVEIVKELKKQNNQRKKNIYQHLK